MKHLKTLSSILLVAAVSLPAITMAQGEEKHDDRRTEQKVERGAGPDHAWHKGDRLPDSYRANQYVVNDWRGHHLRQPPSGYHWVQVNGDYVLAAVATGVIADMLLNN
jgi:Ni/Co efflux regulator RcnB